MCTWKMKFAVVVTAMMTTATALSANMKMGNDDLVQDGEPRDTDMSEEETEDNLEPYVGNRIPSEEDRKLMWNDVKERDPTAPRVSPLWPDKTIPYEISREIGGRNRQLIWRAMQNISSRTCIKFKQRTNEADYVLIQSRAGGCYSIIGRQGRRQILNLENGRTSCMYESVIAHELIHAIGFDHEQNRPDRDRYVKVLFQNIIEYYKGNFVKRDTRTYTPYDYKSIMHYQNYDFSKYGNQRPTIIPAQGKFFRFSGYELTKYDAEKINRMYGCRVKS